MIKRRKINEYREGSQDWKRNWMLHSIALQYIGVGTVFTVYSSQYTPEYTVGGHSVQTQHTPVSTQHTSVSAQSSHYTPYTTPRARQSVNTI